MSNAPIIRRITDLTPAEHGTRHDNREALDSANVEKCKVCPKPVWFTAFFDGTGNNYGADGNGSKDVNLVKYSNIAKLAQFAHVGDSSASRTASRYIEGVGTPCAKVGDSGEWLDGALGMAAASKGELRIRWMLNELNKHVSAHMPAVSQINLAVFGFSRGATEARAFVRMLNERLAESDQNNRLWWRQPNMNGARPEVVVYFMGILDTVSSTGFGGSNLERQVEYRLGPLLGGCLYYFADEGGHAAWANDLRIPAHVRQCVHFVASHECREKFPSDSVREDKTLPSNCVEIFYPGMHSDVGGGYTRNTQEGRTNELANVALNNLYIEAWKAGVPFKPPAEVMKDAGPLFAISPELEDLWNVYMAQGNQQAGGPAPGSNRLEINIIWHMNRYYQWRASRSRRLHDGRLKPPGGVDHYMAITDREWNDDSDNIRRMAGGFLTSSISDQWKAIDAATRVTGNWLGALDPVLRQKFDRFFDVYVHDSIAGFKNQMADSYVSIAEGSRWTIGRRYFMGKRGKKFLYWTYAGDKAAEAATQTAMRDPATSSQTGATADAQLASNQQATTGQAALSDATSAA
ncbi:uncharacterized protein (DUF2235 family) [Paraburkholderia bannensis]|uniref:Uncharacterized protein (DUF2235 family) n=1 Tax=Paraburkholderia bannensis TaxID=765414 RepID=A0A7W9U360_9BURK|nr:MULTISPECIES: DUF2235 domain-containing protein [Paraburkholderia]MBB3261151.1 hypothetical protein [Paraburkholderia sp. WP4_3_2]MBB6106188.1 uncharacterized protein (DUF2235 family) [Paraburkholderia bannensis]